MADKLLCVTFSLSVSNKMCSLVDLICNRAGYKLFLGDFKFPNINWNTGNTAGSSQSKLINTLQKIFLQHVNTPTRARGSATPHLLDLIITDDSFVENTDYAAPLGKSDHSILHVFCNLKPVKYQFLDKFGFSKGDNEGLCNEVQLIDWNEKLLPYSDNIDQMWQNFKCKLEKKYRNVYA